MEAEMYVSKYLTFNEIELLRRLCAAGLASAAFTEKEKNDIKSMLENDLV